MIGNMKGILEKLESHLQFYEPKQSNEGIEHYYICLEVKDEEGTAKIQEYRKGKKGYKVYANFQISVRDLKDGFWYGIYEWR